MYSNGIIIYILSIDLQEGMTALDWVVNHPVALNLLLAYERKLKAKRLVSLMFK